MTTPWTDGTPESMMKEEGVLRFRKAKVRAKEKNRESQVGGTRRLADVTISRLIEAVQKYLQVSLSKRGAKEVCLADIKAITPETAAYITVRTVFDGIGASDAFTHMCVVLGARLEDELRFREFKRTSLLSYSRSLRDTGNAGSYKYKRQILLRKSTRDDLVPDWVSWKIGRKMKAGARLISLLVEATGLFEIRRQTLTPRKKPYFIFPTQKCLDLIAKGDAFEELMCPWFLPMTRVPEQWTTPWDGGYESFELPLVKRGSKDYYKRLSEASIQPVLDAVNALQGTAWCVNTDVLEVYRECQTHNIHVPGMPAPEPQPMPPMLDWMVPLSDMTDKAREEFQEGLREWQQVELKTWKQAAGRSHAFNRRRESHTIAYSKILTVAELYREEPCFYMPYQLDWRGRVYSVPLFLNPQGNDLSRGLLQFAESRAFGNQDAVDWWMVEGSNRFGNDKVPFGERIDWIRRSHRQILEVNDAPAQALWWTKADKPFQFLQWCLEYGRWVDSCESLAFLSSCVVSMDGSCNGLQHLSALMLDEEGAKATNLLPADHPQDIYALVCQKVEAAVRRELGQVLVTMNDGRQEWKGTGVVPEGVIPPPALVQQRGLAGQWLKSGLLNRSLVKQPVMTKPYGATTRGMTLQVGKYLQEVADKGTEVKLEDPWEAIRYIAPHIITAIDETVTGANICMDWMMSCAKIIAKSGLPLRWMAPTGLPVEQHYPALKRRRVQAILLGNRRRLTLRVDQGRGTTDRMKMVLAVVPNVIHSFDGAHLMLTVGAMERQHGHHSWAMVHDSFGCHAADADNLATCLREQFVRMYEDGQAMERWRQGLMQDTGLWLPEPPEQGELDLQQVLEAMFFFA